METANKLLGNNIRRQRESRGWTQSDLAEECGLSVNMIQKLEHGRTNPSGETIDTLCRVLSVAAADLYRGSMALIPDVTSAADFLAKFADLSPVLQRLVLSLVYQDESYARGVKLNPEALAEVQKLFGPLQKAR